AVTSEGNVIKAEDFPFYNQSFSLTPPSEKSLKEVVQEVERDMIIRAIVKHQTTRKAAKSLGISQSTLVKKMQRLGI
ncbi:MAG TPA: helix-turn-helix domain-containing protein, partial [Chondromyces sp.]|nr:helix-turn-helix domain-containing protein [Chondromyces sp.]